LYLKITIQAYSSYSLFSTQRMETTKRILLTGASGTIGIEVLHLLVEQEAFKVFVFDKKSNRSTKLFSPYKNKIEILYGDLSNENDIRIIPDHLDIVIHLGAIIPPKADENPVLTQLININGTKSIIETLEKRSPNAFFLFSSSISVYGDRVQNPDITINDALNPSNGDVYGDSKVHAEEIIKNSKLDWSIFRLAAIMKNHKLSKLMFHMPLNTQLEICTPKDTARAFMNAINKREILKGRIFNLGGGEKCRITYEMFLEKSFRLFGLGKINFPLHSFAQKNFHCGFYKDGDILENILHFRNDTLESYFNETKRSIPFITKLMGTMFRVIIKQLLLNQSEPLRAVKTNDKALISHFFLKKEFPVTS